MKRFIVILLVLILVAGGSAGGLMMLGIIPNPFTPEIQGPMSDADRAAAQAEKRKFQGPTAAYALVKVDDMIIPVIIDGQATRRVFIILRLMAASKSDEAVLQAGMRKYQDAVIQDFVPFFQKYYLEHDMVDAKMVKERLLANAKRIYGDKVKDVILTNVFEQSTGR